MSQTSKAKQFFTSIILKWKRQILASIILSSLFSLYLFYTKSVLDDKLIFDLLKSFLEINGVLLGFIIAFFLFVTQSNQNNRQIWYLEYRRSVDDLVEIFLKLSAEKDPIAEHIAPAVDILDQATFTDIPCHVDNRQEIHEAAEKLSLIRKRKKKLVGKNILSKLLKIENALNSIGLTTISVVVSGMFLDSIKKLALQIVLGIIFMFIWKFVFTGASLYVIFGTLILLGLLTCGSIGELVVHFSLHYRDTSEESGIETNKSNNPDGD